MPAERVISFRPRAILTFVGVLLAIGIALSVVWIARSVITWILVALFLALALNPAVEWLHQRTGRTRGLAVALIFVSALLAVAILAAVVIPTIVNQVSDFVQAVPGYIHDLTHGRGPLGSLETKFHIVEKVKKAVGTGGAGSKLLSQAGVLVSVGKSIATAVAAVVTIIFLTLFMLLEGPTWVERVYGLMADDQRLRYEQVGHEIYRTIGGYVTGNLLISLICGVIYGIALAILGVPYPVALGFIVAVLDLVPLAGATIGGLIVVGVALTVSVTAGIVMAIVVIVYQQVENHVLQPVIYGRTVALSPLAVLIAVLIGAEVAGVLGALGAIPIAGALQVVLIDQLEHRRARRRQELAAGGAVAEDRGSGGLVIPQTP